MTAIKKLLAVAEAYAAAEKVELKTVSYRVFKDSKKLDAILAGADIHVGRYERALQWFSARWPAAATWPEHVARPYVEAA